MNLSSIKKNEIIKGQFKMTNISGEKLRKIKQVTHHNVVKNCKQPDNGVSEQVIINNHTCILNRAGVTYSFFPHTHFSPRKNEYILSFPPGKRSIY